MKIGREVNKNGTCECGGAVCFHCWQCVLCTGHMKDCSVRFIETEKEDSELILLLEQEITSLYIDAAWERDEELNTQWAKGMEASANRIKNVINKYKVKNND